MNVPSRGDADPAELDPDEPDPLLPRDVPLDGGGVTSPPPPPPPDELPPPDEPLDEPPVRGLGIAWPSAIAGTASPTTTAIDASH